MPEVISLKTIVVAAKDLVSSSPGDKTSILHMGSEIYYGLEPVGARVWSLLGEPRSVGELLSTLLAEYEVGPDRCEGDLLELLEKLRREGLIEILSPAEH